MTDLNSVTLIGRLTRDPEIKAVGTGQIARFSIAVNESYKKDGQKNEKVHFLDCQAWDRLAEIIGKYGHKGQQVALSGKLVQQSWTTDTGENRSKIVVTAETFQMLGRKRDEPGTPEEDIF